MDNFTPGSALAGGAMIGLAATLLLLINGRVAGISGIANGLFGRGGKGWRIAFLSGLVLAPAVYAALAPLPFAAREGFPLWLLALAGLFVGYGTRLGSGCTSGHGVCGIGRLSPRSLAATAVFLVVGMVTASFLTQLLATPGAGGS